jgi:polyisoprenoid-binding protein YceI
MFTAIRHLGLAAFLLIGGATGFGPPRFGATALAADTFSVDPVHSSISFMISHAGISFIHGRFDEFSGKFAIDKLDPARSTFALSIKTDSVDTNHKTRDEHLRESAFFDVKEFPAITFESSQVKPIEGGYEVVGALTLRGVTRPITLTLKGGEKTVEFPKGTQRIGIVTTTALNRSDFDMKAGLPSLGDEVLINIAIEAAKE